MMLTPKEKAQQLVSLHSLTMLSEIGNKLIISEVRQIAKQSALITVDELINMSNIYDNHNVDKSAHIFTFNTVLYLQEVKKEIENYE